MTEPTNTPAEASPHEQAYAAAVPSARGWFRFNDGSVNVRYSGAVMTPQYDDGQYRVVAVGTQGLYELLVGPYADADTASAVADAVLKLAYDDTGWPTAAAAG